MRSKAGDTTASAVNHEVTRLDGDHGNYRVPRRDQQSNMAERSAGYTKPTLHALLGSESHHTYL
jgi:hypothetical protein